MSYNNPSPGFYVQHYHCLGTNDKATFVPTSENP